MAAGLAARRTTVVNWADQTPDGQESAMPTYRMVYGDDEQVVRETLENVEMEKEDGWVVFFRDGDSILRVHEEHIQELETLDEV